jgi:hypothetical protein
VRQFKLPFAVLLSCAVGVGVAFTAAFGKSNQIKSNHQWFGRGVVPSLLTSPPPLSLSRSSPRCARWETLDTKS